MPSADPSPPTPGILTSTADAAALPKAWQPITPRGVAAFSRARVGRLWLVQVIIAALVAGVVCWFLSSAWFPVAIGSIRHLPDSGGITNGVLRGPHTTTQSLAQNRFLAFSVDLEGHTGADVPADVLVTFRRADFRVCSLLGCLTRPYDRAWQIAFTRLELEAAWGAWRSTVLVIAATGTLIALFASWFALATAACPLVRLYSFFKDREITLLGSWKLAGAALLPGALVATGLIVLYGLGVIDLVRFLIGWVLHFLVALIYLAVAPLKLPRAQDSRPSAANPFTDLPRSPADEPPSGDNK